MKRFLTVCAAPLLAAVLVVSAFAAEFAPVVWADEAETPDISAKGGYPRLAELSDGTLLACHGEYISFSSDDGKTWTETKPLPAAGTYTSETTTHTLSKANHQPYVLPGMGENGQDLVFVAYRSHTKGFDFYTAGEFYTSIRIVASMDGGKTFGDEVVLIEGICNRATEGSTVTATTSSFRGYWEPMMLQINDNEMALYYADDLSVAASHAGNSQQIRYLLYDISTGTWDTTPYLAIDGETRTGSVYRRSRDGMPSVTKLMDGSFAMVIETFDYNIRPFADSGKSGHAEYVVSLARSLDGKTWDQAGILPIIAPTDVLTATSIASGHVCAAPYIATLPDGRVAISYQTDEDYLGSTDGLSTINKSNLSVVVSNAPLTYDSAVAYTTGGPSSSFTKLEDPFGRVENGYQLWNSVSCYDGHLYVVSSTNVNGETGKAAVKLRRADLVIYDLNDDGKISFFDVLIALRAIGQGGGEYFASQLDYNADGSLDIADALSLLRTAMKG